MKILFIRANYRGINSLITNSKGKYKKALYSRSGKQRKRNGARLTLFKIEITSQMMRSLCCCIVVLAFQQARPFYAT